MWWDYLVWLAKNSFCKESSVKSCCSISKDEHRREQGHHVLLLLFFVVVECGWVLIYFFRVYGYPLYVFCISNIDCLIYSNWTSHWISQDKKKKTIKVSNYFTLLGGLQSWFTASTGTIIWYAHVAVRMTSLLFYSPMFTFFFSYLKQNKKK